MIDCDGNVDVGLEDGGDIQGAHPMLISRNQYLAGPRLNQRNVLQRRLSPFRCLWVAETVESNLLKVTAILSAERRQLFVEAGYTLELSFADADFNVPLNESLGWMVFCFRRLTHSRPSVAL